MKPAPPVSRTRMAWEPGVPGSSGQPLACLQTSYDRGGAALRWSSPLAAWTHEWRAGAGGRRRADRARGGLALPGARRLSRGRGRRRAGGAAARALHPGTSRPGRAGPDAARHGRPRGVPAAPRQRADPDRDADRPRPRGRPDRRARARRGRLRGEAVQPAGAGRQNPQRAPPRPGRPGGPAGPRARRRRDDRPGDQGGRGRRAPGRPDRAGVRAAAVPGPPPAPGVHARSAPAAGVGVHLARGHLDRHRAHPAPAREGRGQPLRPAADPDGLRGRLPLRAAGAERVTGRWRASLVAAAIFAGGLAGSVAVALAVDIPAHDLVLLLGLTTIGAVAVVLVGLVVQGGLRRRGAGVARHVGLTAVVTAGAALAAIQAASSAMLVSTHDLLVVLVSLPVAIGAGIAYGIASSRAMVTDLEALAARAAALEAGAGASSPAEQARPSVAGRRSGGTAEVATVAEALEAAEARLAAARERERAMDASRRDLIAWISPDLRTPLASLRALAEALADGGALVLAGRDQLNRVLANLVHNGIRHTRPGGRLLVTIGQRADGGAVTLRVRDGCGGIAEPDLARVFDRLWRGDPARSSRGAGLGLAIARGFVEAHGGTIRVANVTGGCEFTVELPASSRQGPAARPAAVLPYRSSPGGSGSASNSLL